MLYFLSKASTKDMPHYNGIVNWFRQCSVNHTHTHTPPGPHTYSTLHWER